MRDELGNRMKTYYENRFKQFLLRRTYIIIRIDGKAFHTFTHQCDKPFDKQLMGAIIDTAVVLCNNIEGAKFAYTQSDEISILLTDFDKLTTQMWFDGNVQKICSVSASMATANFNFLYNGEMAMFDARVFQLPNKQEVINYFIWRQQDATRNSIQSVAQSLYSHKELHGKNSFQLQEMIFQRGLNWDTLPTIEKRGTAISKIKTSIEKEIEGERWIADYDAPIFSKSSYLQQTIPSEE